MIGTMDNSILNFKNLSILNLSNNKIKRVQNLPATLRELYLSNNEISEFEALKNPLNSLIHIGVAYNKVNN
jgi:Leucine-rich repeat (LRR) protein